MSEELKPCPLGCESKIEFTIQKPKNGYMHFGISCSKCFVNIQGFEESGEVGNNTQLLKGKWNYRPREDKLEAALKDALMTQSEDLLYSVCDYEENKPILFKHRHKEILSEIKS